MPLSRTEPAPPAPAAPAGPSWFRHKYGWAIVPGTWAIIGLKTLNHGEEFGVRRGQPVYSMEVATQGGPTEYVFRSRRQRRRAIVAMGFRVPRPSPVPVPRRIVDATSPEGACDCGDPACPVTPRRGGE